MGTDDMYVPKLWFYEEARFMKASGDLRSTRSTLIFTRPNTEEQSQLTIEASQEDDNEMVETDNFEVGRNNLVCPLPDSNMETTHQIRYFWPFLCKFK